MSTRILELSKNESTNRALNTDERRLEKRKNSSSARAPSSHGFRNSRVGIWGSGNMQLPCPMVSVLLTTVNTIIYTTQSGERHVCKAVLWAPHNIRVLPQVNIKIGRAHV